MIIFFLCKLSSTQLNYLKFILFSWKLNEYGVKYKFVVKCGRKSSLQSISYFSSCRLRRDNPLPRSLNSTKYNRKGNIYLFTFSENINRSFFFGYRSLSHSRSINKKVTFSLFVYSFLYVLHIWKCTYFWFYECTST